MYEEEEEKNAGESLILNEGKGAGKDNKDLQIRVSSKLHSSLMHICKYHMRGKK